MNEDIIEYRAAIICPVPREYQICKSKLGLINETVKNKKKLSMLTKNKILVAAVSAGIGKINCAAAAQRMISELRCDIIIDSGSAGALDEKCSCGDIVFAVNSYEHDILHEPGFNNLKKELSSSTIMKSVLAKEKSRSIFNEFSRLINEKNGCEVFAGDCASGEKNVNSKKMKETLKTKFNGIICNWETSAVLKTANLCGVPCLSIRTISDSADENMMSDYKKNANGSLEKLYEAIAIFIYDGWMKKIIEAL
jgi:5'-methylthioadenosine/S-adenosylhomocysteine nucleosidase